MTDAYVDSFGRWAQLSGRCGVQLVRLTALEAANRYWAVPLELAAEGAAAPVADGALSVLNLAEPANQAGQLEAGLDAVALDVEGRWVIFVRPTAPGGSTVFLARVAAALDSGAYTVVEQQALADGGSVDREGGLSVTAHNLAERDLGPGDATPLDARVLVLTVSVPGEPPTAGYVFDHPLYARYLDVETTP